MTTNRAYRYPRTPEQAIDELRRCSGVQFDNTVIDAFVQAYGDGSTAAIA
jgi:HD-GYP domain-containing protein (c-di-GMP phosphodiesterase class II)